MSIIDSFDESKPIITPDKFYKKIEKITDICIVTFSYHVRDEVLKRYKAKEINYVACCNGHIPIYYLEDLDVLFNELKAYVDDKEVGTVSVTDEKIIISDLNLSKEKYETAKVELRGDVISTNNTNTVTFKVTNVDASEATY